MVCCMAFATFRITICVHICSIYVCIVAGLGDPLLGPSAIDAIMNGCMYINPIYDIPKEHHGAKFHSQHPFAASHFNKSIVCSASFHKPAQVLTCVKSALASTATPSFEPLPALALFQHDAYMGRVKSIFNI